MSKKVRLLITTSNFNTAGSGKVIYDLARGLDKTKFEVEIACGHDKGYFFDKISSLGFPIHIFSTKTAYRPYYTLILRLVPIVCFFKRNKYDIVHSWQWSNDWTEALASRLTGSKWIYTKKAMGFNSNHWKVKSYLANSIITLNDEMIHYFSNQNKVQLIPLGLDTDYYKSSNVNKMAPDAIFKIITVANLVPVKGVEVLLYALALLNDDCVHLTILGDDDNDYGRSMKSLSHTLGLQNQVIFSGKQSDVRPYIDNADVYVIPTIDKGEGMPMALVEAMSMGIPVLGSDISGINYVLKSFPELLFRMGDSKSLSDKIKIFKSMKSEERRHIGDQLRAYSIEHFTLEGFIEAHEALYLKLLKD